MQLGEIFHNRTQSGKIFDYGGMMAILPDVVLNAVALAERHSQYS